MKKDEYLTERLYINHDGSDWFGRPSYTFILKKGKLKHGNTFKRIQCLEVKKLGGKKYISKEEFIKILEKTSNPKEYHEKMWEMWEEYLYPQKDMSYTGNNFFGDEFYAS